MFGFDHIFIQTAFIHPLVAMSADEQPVDVEEENKSLPMAKYFASSGGGEHTMCLANESDVFPQLDKAVRDKAVKNLERFLVARGDVIMSDKEMTKLWKGLFFCRSVSPPS